MALKNKLSNNNNTHTHVCAARLAVGGHSLWPAALCWLLLALLAVVRPVAAYEPLWRAQNTSIEEVVPPYAGNVSPFPIRSKQTAEVQEEAPVLTEEQRNQEMRARKSVELLNAIRQLIADEKAFDPDLSRIVIKAKLKGPEGYKVLVGNRWIAEGDKLEVPVMRAAAIQQLLANLVEIDQNLGVLVEEDVVQKLSENKPVQLSIVNVKDKEVTLRSNKNKTYTVPFVSSGW